MKESLFISILIVILFCYSCKKEKGNSSPKIDMIELDSAVTNPGGTINVQVFASDPDKDQLNYSYTVSDGNIVGFGSNVQIIAPMDYGIYNLNVIVTDGKGGEATGYEVFYVNSKPIINKITISPDTMLINSTAEIKVYAVDPDGEQLTYEYLPETGIIEGSGSSVTWTAPDYPGSFKIDISVSDSKNTVKTDRTISVRINTAPVITEVLINPDSVLSYGVAQVTVNASDPDGDALTFEYATSGGSISGSGSSVMWTAPFIGGTYSLNVIVSDGYGGTATANATLIVQQQTSSSTTITGTAYFIAGVSGDLSNSLVSIYTSLDNWNFNQPIKTTTTIGSGASVTFSMTNVHPGNYYLDVWKDIDNSGTWTSGDYVGWYGSGGLGSPVLTEFQISQGQTLNLDVQMYIIAKGMKLPK